MLSEAKLTKIGTRPILLTHGYYPLDKVIECLDGGANVNALDDSKNNVLIWAVDKKNLPMVKLLVEFGADLHQKNKYGNNALAAAKRRKFTEIEQFLREQLE